MSLWSCAVVYTIRAILRISDTSKSELILLVAIVAKTSKVLPTRVKDSLHSIAE